MNKKFIKLCLASILSLALNTNLQAQELNQSYSCTQEEEEEDIGEAISEYFYSDNNSFIQELRNERPDIRACIYDHGKHIMFSQIENSGQNIDDVLGCLSTQEWVESLEKIDINGLQHESDALLAVLSKTPQLKSLSLSHLELDAKYLIDLFSTIAQMPNLQHLSLEYDEIMLYTISNFMNTIQIDGLPNLRSLSLSESLSIMSQSRYEALRNFLDSTPNLQNLTVSEALYLIGQEGFQSFADFLFLMPNLEHLDLSDNSDIGKSLTALVPAIAEMHNLQYLDLSWITAEASLAELAPALAGTPKLKYLSLEGNDAGDAIVALVPALAEMHDLENLNLGANNTGNALAALAPAFANMPNLQSLTLELDKMDESVMIEFARILFETEGFEGLFNLRELTLGSAVQASFGPNGFEAFGAFLSLLPNVQKLNLPAFWCSEIDEGNLQELFSAIALNLPNLKTLNFEKSDLAGKLAALAPALANMTNLNRLDLENSELDAAGLISLAEAVTQIENFEIPNLTDLNLSFNELGDMDPEGWQALAAIISYMPSLNCLDLCDKSLSLNEVCESFISILPEDSKLEILIQESGEDEEEELDEIFEAISSSHQNISIALI